MPVAENTVAVKRCSDDNEYVLHQNLLHKPTVVKVEISDFVACIYEQKWWIGIVTDIDSQQSDLQIKFMHPYGPARSFHWPRNDDVCWVPLTHVIKKSQFQQQDLEGNIMLISGTLNKFF